MLGLTIDRSRIGRARGHLYQLIYYRDRFAVPPSFREPIANRAIAKAINESHHAQRASPFRNPHPFCNPLRRPAHVVQLQKRFALCLAPRRMRAAFLNCWGSCTPLAYFFLLLKKSKSPKASKATHDAFGPNALEKRAMQMLICAYQNLVTEYLVGTDASGSRPYASLLPSYRQPILLRNTPCSPSSKTSSALRVTSARCF